MRRSFPALLFVVAGLLPASSAFAQTTTPGGVTVDPNSPSGTEYDIPVQKARRDAQGTKKAKPKDAAAKQSTTSSSGDGSAPLFGEGVQPEKQGTTATATTPPPTTTQAAPHAATPKRPKTTSTQAPAPPTETVMSSPQPSEQLPPPQEIRDAQLAAKAATADNGPAPAVPIAGGAVVLLLAGLSGWWLRRRSG